MAKAIQKQGHANSNARPFGVLSLAIARRIDDSDRCAALDAANYRYASAMRELEQQFEIKASELRRAYLDEVATAHSEIAP